MLVDAPALIVSEEAGREVHGGSEAALAVVEGGPHAVVAEADDVRKAVVVEVDDEARMLVDLPALLNPEIRQDGLRVRVGEGAVRVLEGSPDARVRESDDIGTAVLVDVDDKARMLLDPPALVVAVVIVNRARGLKSADAVPDRRPHKIGAEADDVGEAVAVDVEHEPRVPVDQPALVVAEIVQRKSRGLKGSVAVSDRRPNAVVAEADHVGEAVLVQIREKPWVLVDLPASGVEAEIGVHDDRILERAFAVPERRPHAAGAEGDDVGKAAGCQRPEKAGMLVHPPSERDGEVYDAPAAHCPGDGELAGIGLGPGQLRPVRAAVARRPDVGI